MTLYLVGTDRWLLAAQTALDTGWFRHRTALGWPKSRAFDHCRAVGRVDLVPATGLQPIDDPYHLSPNLKAVT